MNFIGYWLIFCVWAQVAGWGLSAIHRLDSLGYGVALIGLFLAWLWWFKSGSQGLSRFKIPRLRTFRCSKIVFWLWVIVMIFCLCGGLLHPPRNYDALTYRLPRVLYWLQDQRWTWIGAFNDRIDYSAQGQEWQISAIFAFIRSDRFLFVLNWLPALFLPSLIFRVLIMLHCRRRIAWYAMWSFPMMYGIVMQIGSIGNDLSGVLYGMAALAFIALPKTELKKSKRLSIWLMSAISIALVGAVKASNLPLSLPLGCVWLYQGFCVLKKTPKIFLRIILISLIGACFASILPTLILNIKNTGSWMGADENTSLKVKKIMPGLTGNVTAVALGSIQLPLQPLSKQMNETIQQISFLASVEKWIQTGFSRFTLSFGGEMPSEESSGLGLPFGILGAWCFVSLLFWSWRKRLTSSYRLAWILLLTTTIAGFAYCSLLASECAARLLLPYYLPWFCAAVSLSWWPISLSKKSFRKWNGLFVSFPAFAVLPGVLLTPNRPCLNFPWWDVLPISETMKFRCQKVYQVYAQRNSFAESLVKEIPEGSLILWGGNSDDPSYAIQKSDQFECRELSERTIQKARLPNQSCFIITNQVGLFCRLDLTVEEFFNQNSSAQIIQKQEFVSKVGEGKINWYVIKLY